MQGAMSVAGTSAIPYDYWCMGMEDRRRRREQEAYQQIPGKHSDTRIKPLPLTNGHGRYTTVTSERTFFSVVEWPLHIIVII
jgi:hypothetical protein